MVKNKAEVVTLLPFSFTCNHFFISALLLTENIIDQNKVVKTEIAKAHEPINFIYITPFKVQNFLLNVSVLFLNVSVLLRVYHLQHRSNRTHL